MTLTGDHDRGTLLLFLADLLQHELLTFTIGRGRAVAKHLVHLLKRAAAGLGHAEEDEDEGRGAEGAEEYIGAKVGRFDERRGDETLARW